MITESGNKLINYDDPEYRITPFQQAAASCTGAVLTSLLVTPLDVVKTRLQAQQTSVKLSKCFLYCNGLMDHLCRCTPEGPYRWYQNPGHFSGTLDAFIKISRIEGVGSLWSGLSPTLILAVPATIVYFVTYEQLRLKLRDAYNKKRPPDSASPYKQPYWIPLVSGATARTFAVSLVSPLELIRTKMQSQKLSYLELSDALKILIRQDGIGGLWKGIFPTLLRDVPFSAIYWLSYETIKSRYGTPDSSPSFWLSFSAGAISGIVAAAITVPFDVIKTHQQIEFGETTFSNGKPKVQRTMLEIFTQIHTEHGMRGLFAGLVPRLIKIAPACAIMISSFEYGKVFFNRLANRQLSIQNIDSHTLPAHRASGDVTLIKNDTVVSNSTSQDVL